MVANRFHLKEIDRCLSRYLSQGTLHIPSNLVFQDERPALGREPDVEYAVHGPNSRSCGIHPAEWKGRRKQLGLSVPPRIEDLARVDRGDGKDVAH